MATPDSFGFTLAARNWFDRYWKPVNALGYRDVEREISDMAGRRVILVVGDSFVAGQGIEDPADRFSDRIARDLGDDHVVLNVARLGWSTGEEVAALRTHPARPDIVVWSYYVNDIEGAARARGRSRPVVVEKPADWIFGLVERSHLANFVYWRVWRHTNRHLTHVYWEYLRAAYADPDVWALHRLEILSMVDLARARGARLVAVVFPYLVDIAASAEVTLRVVRLLEEEGVSVLDMTKILEGRDPSELVVNALDCHPNEDVHREVARLLVPHLTARR